MENNNEVQDSTADDSNGKRLWATHSFYNAASYINYNYQLMTAAQLLAVTHHSTVHKSYSQVFGSFVAIKVIDRKAIPACVVEKFLPRELEITKLVNHPHIVRCFHITQPLPTKYIIVSEYCAGGTLLKYVLKNKGLAEKEAARLFRQLVEAVAYLHYELSVAHRDIKLENILLDFQKVLKLADFGFARQTRKAEKSTSFCGTRPYSAPQLVDNRPYDAFAADFFACGITLYTMIAGFWPHEQWEKITYPLAYSEKISYGARQLISRLVEKEEGQRACYHECVNSSWLATYTADGSWMVPLYRQT